RKHPVSMLQEMYKTGITPIYDLIHAEGPSHETTFTYNVSVGDLNDNNGRWPVKEKSQTCGSNDNSGKVKTEATAKAMVENGEKLKGWNLSL
ncbi:hypothetical protein QYM36_009619, partial [Artemia franciscana]